ncbi:MAG: hypothetical protein Q9227_008530 [Pyrenula ochraceoflavens]
MAAHSRDRNFQIAQTIIDWYPKIVNSVNTPVHYLVSAQAARNPETQAVCSWDGVFTYGELEHLATRLARYLASIGVGPEEIVPLYFEKSRWTIVSLLAVLKAGGAFLMLDPSQPASRLKTIIAQTSSIIALSSAECFDICKALVDQTFAVNAETLSNLRCNAQCQEAKRNNAAYMIFTSGSTGTPKGVVIENSQLSTTSLHTGKCLGFGNGARIFQFASYAFDVSVGDIFPTLVNGATLCIPSEWERDNAIVDAMCRMEVTHAKFTPSLVANLAIEDVPTLKTLILGGESSPRSLIEAWTPKVNLILSYGPSECCVMSFLCNANLQQTAPGELGRPVNARGWIVKRDDYNQLADIGEIGELLIEGPLVGRGYLHDKIKTDQQFVLNPAWISAFQSCDIPCRMYRTGDLARYLEDGRVCYVGRVDNQVKIRGQRLELEEVEKRLQDCLTDIKITGSKHIVVDAVTFSGTANKQLVAFLCLSAVNSIGYFEWDRQDSPIMQTSAPEQERFSDLISKLEANLKMLLPVWAVPSVWIPLRQLPFTVSRKIDRQRLNKMASSFPVKQLLGFLTMTGPRHSHQATAMWSEKEERLRNLWAEACGIQPSRIEVDDNFFSIGGDSVLAIRLVATARASGLDISLDIVFRQPVLRDMAHSARELITKVEDEDQLSPFDLLHSTRDAFHERRRAAEACSILEDNIEDIYPCSPFQESVLASYVQHPGTYDERFIYRIAESVDLVTLKAAWQAVARRTHVLRTRFFDYNSTLLQVVVNEPIKWETVDGYLADFLVSSKKHHTPISGVLSQFAVVRTPGSHQSFFVWSIHHALIDGWAESQTVKAVEEEYFKERSVDTKNLGFRKFIRHVQQQDNRAAQRFWMRQLVNAPSPTFPPLPYPTHVPSVERSSHIKDHLEAFDSAEFVYAVSLSQKSPHTTATLVQAAWILLLGIHSNATDIVTGTTFNGRAAQLKDIERILGPTVATLPFRVRFRPDQKLADFLNSVQDQYLNITPYSQYGLQNIKQLNEDTAAACQFRCLLVIQPANKSRNLRLLRGRSYMFSVKDLALVMECELSEENVEFRATFDHQCLSEVHVRRLCRQMEHMLQTICSSDASTTIFDVQRISKADIAQILEWNDIEYHENGRDMGPLKWIVDPNNLASLTPVGGVGEVLIEEDGYTRSNDHHRPETESRSLEDLLGTMCSDYPKAGTRFHRTGDLASYNDDGSLSFVGRREDFFGSRGQRINILEVEERLNKLTPSSSRIAAAVVRPKDSDEALTAFVTIAVEGVDPSSETALANSSQSLEQFRGVMEKVDCEVHSLFPRQMVPKIYIPISKVPFTASAKVDRKKLQALVSELSMNELLSLQSNNTATRNVQVPHTEVENGLVGLWKALFDTGQVEVDDDFFKLGGNRALAMRLVTMAWRSGLTMTVSSIFRTPVLQDMASNIEQHSDSAEYVPFCLLEPKEVDEAVDLAVKQCRVNVEEIEDVYPLTAMQMHYITGYPEGKKDLDGPWDWESKAVYTLPRSIDTERFKSVWEHAIRLHVALRTRVIKTSSGIFQVVLTEPEPFKWNEASNLEDYLEADRSNPMKFGSRLIRLAIVDPPASEERFFVMTVQHLTYDAYARYMLFRELATLYHSAEFPLSPVNSSPAPEMGPFIKYVTQDANKSAAISFWTAYLSDAHTTTFLTNPPSLSSLPALLPFRITEKSLSMPLPSLKPTRTNNQPPAAATATATATTPVHCTLPTLLEVSTALALAAHSPTNHHHPPTDILFYSDRSGRSLPLPTLPHLLGPTTLFLPLRIPLSPFTQPLASLLTSTQRASATILPHSHTGWLELFELDVVRKSRERAEWVNLNINPWPNEVHARVFHHRQGMEWVKGEMGCDDAFGVNIDLFNEEEAEGEGEGEEPRIVVTVFFDERFVGEGRVAGLLDAIRRVVERGVRVVRGEEGEEWTVGEMVDFAREGRKEEEEEASE